MKKYIYMAVAAIAALASCSDNDIIENDIKDNGAEKQALAFTATMEDAPQTRATYDNTAKRASWMVNDQININGHIFEATIAGTSTDFVAPQSGEIRPTFISSSSQGFNSNEGPGKLVDGDGTSTKWCANTSHMNSEGTWDIVVKTAMPVRLQAIELWNANDTKENPGRRWKEVKISGSTSATGGWTEIKTFADANLAINNSDLAGTLDVNAGNAYEYYKVEVLSVVSGSIMQMSDMKFIIPETQVQAPYTAYFPASLYNGSTATLPAEITEEWVDGKFNMPMYAYSTSKNLKFKHLCGVLKLIVKSDQIATVKSIRVSSANKAISGAFTVDANNAAELTNPNEAANTLTINYSTPVATDAAGKVFYIPVPAQTYRDLAIQIISGNYFNPSMTTKSGVDVVVERNRIYPITFIDDNSESSGRENYGVADKDVTNGWYN